MTKKPNILIVQQSPDWGGAEEWMFTLIKHFHKKNIPISLATNFEKFNQKTKDYCQSLTPVPYTLDIIGNYKGLIKSIFLFPLALFWYTKLIKKSKIQGINCVLMSGFSEKILVSWIAKLFKIRVVWLEYGPLEEVFNKNFQLPKFLYQVSYKIPKVIITISKNTKKHLVKNSNIKPNKIKIIYPGTKIPKKKPKYNHHRQIVGHLSRLSPEKGQRLLLRSWKYVVKSLPKAKLIIAGEGPDSENIKKIAKKLRIEKSVQFLGFINNKKDFYKKLSIFVFPSVWKMEGFGIVMIEALSFGIPVVAVDNGPIKEVIKKEFGRISLKTPRSLSDQIIGIIKANQTNIQSQKAYNIAKEKFNSNIQSQKVLDIINKAINN